MRLPGWDKAVSPFHTGEIALQERLGVAERQQKIGRKILRPYLPEQHRTFYQQLPFLIAGSVDQAGSPWASVMFGEPGFITSPGEQSLKIEAKPITGDPLAENLTTGAPVGFLGIELTTRRRNRVNGLVNGVSLTSIDIDVVQSFGNCPQYIQTRDMSFTQNPALPFTGKIEHFDAFDQTAVAMIEQADTFFVASYAHLHDKTTNGGVDVSHRGGNPGFIKVDGNTLTIPDYRGNFAFNTLGNFLVNPQAGLLFIDFDSRDIWQFTGTAELLWEETEDVKAFRGAERFWRFHLDYGVRLIEAAPMQWIFKESSPRTLSTGNWQEAERTRDANRSSSS